MKRLLTLTTLIFATLSIARAQNVAAPPGWCQGCTNGQKAEIATREARSEEVADHNQWPGRPRLPSYGVHGSQHAQFKTHFLVNNYSDKKIKRITWECTLYDRTTKALIQTFTLVNRKDIAPHKSAILGRKVIVSLQNLIAADRLRLILPDSVEVDDNYQIKEIEYVDGSVFRP